MGDIRITHYYATCSDNYQGLVSAQKSFFYLCFICNQAPWTTIHLSVHVEILLQGPSGSFIWIREITGSY